MTPSSPDFGHGIGRAKQVCTPQELYSALCRADEHVHYFEPAFRFAVGAVMSPRIEPCGAIHSDAEQFVQTLLDTADTDAGDVSLEGYASSWSRRVAREFAPTGLTDGVWLQGLTWPVYVEDEVGASALAQLVSRCGDPGKTDSYSERYAALLRSIGIPPGSVSRWGPDGGLPCADISYERALLGLTLGLFPSTLKPEIAGFNLWMTAIGPCPLLESLSSSLQERGACLAYFQQFDRHGLSALARRMIVQLLNERDDVSIRERVSRGFCAASRSYQRWRAAMLGAAIPLTPRDCVVDTVGRKAKFAASHHRRVRLGGCPLDRYFVGDRTDHEELVERLSSSRWISRGSPDESPLVTSVISIDGPMFEIFTEEEQHDLREWIAAAGGPNDVLSRAPAVPLEGTYTAAQDPQSMKGYAIEHYATLSPKELLFRLVNSDRYPAVRLFARDHVANTLGKLRQAFVNDPRLSATACPAYSDRLVADMIVEEHVRNVTIQMGAELIQQDYAREIRLRREEQRNTTALPLIGAVLDGNWLQGCADVTRMGCEEYGQLFRIYASELGDGHVEWNHNYIARRMLRDRCPGVMLPASSRELYEYMPVGSITLMTLSLALNTSQFLPEILGLNLAIEAGGVCGSFVTHWRKGVDEGNEWAALYFRLHNSIDNYSSGHTSLSLAAVQSFIRRLGDVTPDAVDEAWRRMWRIWRFSEIQLHGTQHEQEALIEAVGSIARESAAPLL